MPTAPAAEPPAAPAMAGHAAASGRSALANPDETVTARHCVAVGRMSYDMPIIGAQAHGIRGGVRDAFCVD